jgi:hypothetical protein
MLSIGDRVGRLVVTRDLGMRNGRRRLECRCDCGTSIDVHSANVRAGHTESCGCLKRERTSHRRTTHGHARSEALKTREYVAWYNMKTRCLNPNTKHWLDYGGRGIRVCARWQASFAAFLEDVGHRPSPAHQIDRIDNDGHYEPGNVRWAVKETQMENRRNAIIVTHDGESMTVAQWCKRLGRNAGTVYSRIERGTSPTAALGF